jgi:hypothetical protein
MYGAIALILIIGFSAMQGARGQTDRTAILPVVHGPRGNIVDHGAVGYQLDISPVVSNTFGTPQQALTIFEVRDSTDITIMIAWQENVVNPSEPKKASVVWTPRQSGDYQIRTFSISNFTNPIILSFPAAIDFPVFDQYLISATIFVKRITEGEIQDQNVTLPKVSKQIVENHPELWQAMQQADIRYDRAAECWAKSNWNPDSLSIYSESVCPDYSYYDNIHLRSAVALIHDEHFPFNVIPGPVQSRGTSYGTAIELDGEHPYYSVIVYLE